MKTQQRYIFVMLLAVFLSTRYASAQHERAWVVFDSTEYRFFGIGTFFIDTNSIELRIVCNVTIHGFMVIGMPLKHYRKMPFKQGKIYKQLLLEPEERSNFYYDLRELEDAIVPVKQQGDTVLIYFKYSMQCSREMWELLYWLLLEGKPEDAYVSNRINRRIALYLLMNYLGKFILVREESKEQRQ
ncbi:MAG: hypothetical protein RML40_10915 [Bacteroidota bacterium]|nr:hypothetical protein [Candidatus Kapabacteria bacterium]MDW8221025.1 hypothetical protein [Bacteroidota bacterium]